MACPHRPPGRGRSGHCTVINNTTLVKIQETNVKPPQSCKMTTQYCNSDTVHTKSSAVKAHTYTWPSTRPNTHSLASYRNTTTPHSQNHPHPYMAKNAHTNTHTKVQHTTTLMKADTHCQDKQLRNRCRTEKRPKDTVGATANCKHTKTSTTTFNKQKVCAF